jgi:3-dehydroquinate dehydratase type I
VSLTEKTPEDCKESVSSVETDLIEHRMDFMDRITGLRDIYSATKAPIIATCRSKQMGGNFKGEESERIKHLKEAIIQGASYVDIEVETERVFFEEISAEARKSNCRLIISKHYTYHTPRDSDLIKLLEEMNKYGADIYKIAVTPKSIEDCKRILRLYNIDMTTPLIAFAMGDLGKFTRVSALFLGAPFMYVSQDSGYKAASGQISLSNMKAIVRTLI